MQAAHKVRYPGHARPQHHGADSRRTVHHSHAMTHHSHAVSQRSHSTVRTHSAQGNAAVMFKLFLLTILAAVILTVPMAIERAMLEGNNAKIDRIKTDLNNNAAIQQKKYIELNKLRASSNIEILAVTKYKMVRDYDQQIILYPSVYDADRKEDPISIGGKPSINYEYLTQTNGAAQSGPLSNASGTDSKVNSEPDLFDKVLTGFSSINLLMFNSSI